MSASLIVPLLIGVGVLIAAAVCVVRAPRLPIAIRIVAALAFAPFALFCVFGFVAAMEPGDYHVIWRVGYVIVFLACLLAICRLAFTRRAS